VTSAVSSVGLAQPAYAPALRWLHWLIAILILAAICLGVTAIYLPHGDVRSALLDTHKSIGITVLGLVLLRILFRVATGTPDYRPPLNAFNRYSAGAVHLGLYALMLAIPVSGYVHSSAGGHAFSWFGLYAVPQYVPADKTIDEAAGQAHYVFALAIVALLILHVLATAWHVWVMKDGVFQRIWKPSRR
jgi:cytochrome b561